MMIYGHFSARCRLTGPSDLEREWSEVEDETLFRYSHAEIRTRVVVICHPTRYQVDYGGAPFSEMLNQIGEFVNQCQNKRLIISKFKIKFSI